MRAVVKLGSLIAFSLPIQTVEHVAPPSNGIMLTFGGSSVEVQMCNAIDMEGKLLDVFVDQPDV